MASFTINAILGHWPSKEDLTINSGQREEPDGAATNVLDTGLSSFMLNVLSLASATFVGSELFVTMTFRKVIKLLP